MGFSLANTGAGDVVIRLAQFWYFCHYKQPKEMKKQMISVMLVAVLAGCASSPYGTKVKEPFSGNAYESNNRFFRGTGKGESSSENIARGKADIDAKTILGGQVNTTMKQVADNYQGQTENERGADVAEKFQSLARAVTNTEMADLRKIGEKKYYNQKENRYTVFIAYEIKKNAMFRFMKKQAKLDNSLNESQQALIQKILDEEEKKADAEDEKN
jgi:glycosidase